MFFDDPMLDALTKGMLLSALGLVWIILLVRVFGLRSFSKMTNFDLVITLATGSLLASASQSNEWPGFLQTMTAMACLFTLQFLISSQRRRSRQIENLLQNTPIFLMKDGIVFHHALKKAQITERDLMAKLREANTVDLSSVRAVVLETTGDVSVLNGDHMDDTLLGSVSEI